VTAGPTPAEVGAGVRLEQVRHNAVALLGAMSPAPRQLRVRSGDAAIEIEWPEPAGTAGPAGLAAITEPAAAAPAASGSPAPGDAANGHPATAAATGAAAGAAAGGSPPTDDPAYVTAPVVGTFYHAPAPDADPFVRVGDVVAPGQRIGVLEAMKLMIPVEADRAGRITAVLRANGDSVEYGERLFAFAALEA
jgi:acetyl-CoA carboxylase biotin carboxyl carrier protein